MPTPQSIPSPVAPEQGATLVETIAVAPIIQLYQKRYGLDVAKFFEGSTELSVYRCDKTGYRFFYPYTLAGDGAFYAHLQQYDWYYIAWKWEHEAACRFLKAGDKLLEVGSGAGGFLKGLQTKMPQVEAVGLEFNAQAIEAARAEGLTLLPQMVQEHAKEAPNTYDLACSFQVLEHIAEPYEYLRAQVDALKVGGKLLICVPNNASFIADDKKNILNQPPHHMGLWDDASLRRLAEIFPMKHLETLFEPLQPQHYEFYLTVQAKKRYGNLLGGAYNRLLKWGFFKGKLAELKANADKIQGHSIMVVFEKI